MDLQSVYILLLVLNSIESLVILTVTNNERGFFYWTRITIFSLPTGISGWKSAGEIFFVGLELLFLPYLPVSQDESLRILKLVNFDLCNLFILRCLSYFFESWMILTVDITENIEFEFWCRILTVELTEKYQIVLRWTLIFYDYLRTWTSESKLA